MISLAILAVVVVVVATALHRPAKEKRPTTAAGAPGRAAGIEELLADWTAAGIIDVEQAEAICAFEFRQASEALPEARAEPGVLRPSPGEPGGRRPPPAAVEALGYLGGVLASAGVVLLVSRYWSGASTAGQLALSGLTAAALVAGGWAVPERRDPSMARLRAFLWILGTASVTVFAVVTARDVLGLDAPSTVTAFAATAVTVASGVMWAGRRRPLQHLVALAAAVVAVGSALFAIAGHSGGGLAACVAGVVVLVLGLRALTTEPVIDVLVGSVALGLGSFIVAGDDPGAGLLFPVAAGAVLVGLTLVPRLAAEKAVVAVLATAGGLTFVQAFPPSVAHFAHRAAIPTGAVIWLGAAAVGLAGLRRVTRAPAAVAVTGSALMLVGCAVTGADEPGVATIFGLVTALGLLASSMPPGNVAIAPVGALGLLVYVPWTIGWYFPGEGRVPLLISVSGLVLIGAAVLLARLGDRFSAELRRRPDRESPS